MLIFVGQGAWPCCAHKTMVPKKPVDGGKHILHDDRDVILFNSLNVSENSLEKSLAMNDSGRASKFAKLNFTTFSIMFTEISCTLFPSYCFHIICTWATKKITF